MEFVINHMKEIRNQLCEEAMNLADLESHIDTLLNHMDASESEEFLVHRYGFNYDEISDQHWSKRLENAEAVPVNMLFCDKYLSHLQAINVARSFHSSLSKAPAVYDLVDDITYLVNRHYLGDTNTNGYIKLLAAVCKEVGYEGPQGSIFRQVGENIRKYKRQEFQSREDLMDRYMEIGSNDLNGLRRRLNDELEKRISQLIQSNFNFRFNIFANVKSEDRLLDSIVVRFEILSSPFDLAAFTAFFEQRGGRVGNCNFINDNCGSGFIKFNNFTKLFQD